MGTCAMLNDGESPRLEQDVVYNIIRDMYHQIQMKHEILKETVKEQVPRSKLHT